jgi:hypothetical protein
MRKNIVDCYICRTVRGFRDACRPSRRHCGHGDNYGLREPLGSTTNVTGGVPIFHLRAALERLVEMMDEDSQIIRVDSNFIGRRDNGAWPRRESEWGISAQRWGDYRKIFGQTSFKEGTSRAVARTTSLLLFTQRAW